MKLKQIKLSGFKSFCDDTKFVFKENGITVIVGPNGCGKSNVVDAIRWCLGEQSPKLMRSNNMGDVIFAGSALRKPVGRAEVTLLFDNSENTAIDRYNDYGEISVTRRLYRSGDSEYLINKMSARLMDIRELVMDTGAAGRSYSIVEQGRVDEFVTASPQERRGFMEEAAGIVRYKTKRQTAEKKLEQTRQNLLRVDDVLKELHRQESQLREQMQAAKAYLVLKDEITHHTGDLALLRYEKSANVCNEMEEKLAGLRLEDTNGQQTVMRLGANLQEGNLEHARHETLLRESREAVHHKERDIQQNETRMALETQNLQNGQDWITQLGDALEGHRERRVTLAEQLAENRRELESLDNKTETFLVEITREEDIYNQRKQAQEELAGRMTQLNDQLLECHTQLNGIASQQQMYAERLIEDERRRQGLETRLVEMGTEMQQVRVTLTEKETRSAELAGELERAQKNIQDMGEALTTEEEALTAQQEMEKEAGREVMGIRSRLETLSDIENDYQGFGESVRDFLGWLAEHPDEKQNLGVLGPLADLITVPGDTAEWAGDYLSAYLELIVLEKADTLPSLKAKLEELNLGGLRVVTLDTLPGLNGNGNGNGAGNGSAHLSELVEFSSSVPGLGESLFGHTNLMSAEAPVFPLPQPLGGGAEWLSRDGMMQVDPKVQITLGRSAAPAAGILKRRAEIAELETRLETAEATHTQAQAQSEALTQRIAEYRRQLRTLEEERAERQLAARQVEQEMAQGRREMERLEQVRGGIEQESVRAGEELARYKTQQVELAESQAKWSETRTTLETEVEQVRKAEETARAALMQQSDYLTERKVEQSGAASQLEALKTRIAELDRETETVEAKVLEAEEDLRVHKVKYESGGETIAEVRALLEVQQRDLESLRIEERTQKEAFDTLESAQKERAEQIRVAQRAHEDILNRIHQLELNQTQEKMRMEQATLQLIELHRPKLPPPSPIHTADSTEGTVADATDAAGADASEGEGESTEENTEENTGEDETESTNDASTNPSEADTSGETWAAKGMDDSGTAHRAGEATQEGTPTGESQGETPSDSTNMPESAGLDNIAAEADADMQAAAETQPAPPPVDFAQLLKKLQAQPPELDEKTLEGRLASAQAKMRRMEGVNLAAPQEYEALEERLTFLQSEQEDLLKAVEDLESSIKRMNQESRKRFKETFDAVNIKFQELFPQVFGGGEAHLVMTDSDDPLEAGVDIFAQPPGKKLQSLNLLSGGEKALTAISLIFSFFLHKPSPFCLLDEVDAPLDDVNVTRFNRLIAGMTEQSQFIIITHNKRTMEIGDLLYGVTMEEAGVSKLVSVNLAEQG